MTGQIMLDTTTSDAIQVGADEYLAKTQELMKARIPEDPLNAVSFACSVSVQGCIRSLLQTHGMETAQAIFMGGAEGLGMILGLIEDPLQRAAMFQQCLGAMQAGLLSQARIHQPEGQA